MQFTNDEDASAGSDARDHVGGDTLPFSVILLAEGQELQAAAGEDVVLTLARLPHLPETKPQLGCKWQKKARCCNCEFPRRTFLQVMVGISGSPEAAQGITSSLPAS